MKNRKWHAQYRLVNSDGDVVDDEYMMYYRGWYYTRDVWVNGGRAETAESLERMGCHADLVDFTAQHDCVSISTADGHGAYCAICGTTVA